MLLNRKQAHPFLLAESFQMRLEEGFMRVSRLWDELQSDWFVSLLLRISRTPVPGAEQDWVLWKAERVCRHGPLQPAVSPFSGGDLVWTRRCPPLIQITASLGDSPGLGQGQVRNHRGDCCTQRKERTCPHLPGTFHFIEETDYSGWGVSNNGPLALWADVRHTPQGSNCLMGPWGSMRYLGETEDLLPSSCSPLFCLGVW